MLIIMVVVVMMVMMVMIMGFESWTQKLPVCVVELSNHYTIEMLEVLVYNE